MKKYVYGEPYIALEGEIHNSSSSNLEYMKEKVWLFLRSLHLNTVCVPVFRELIEPERNDFDFDLVIGIIEQARAENVRLVLLWFGLWTNGASNYVLPWVKRDYRTFFLAVISVASVPTPSPPYAKQPYGRTPKLFAG